VTAEKEPSASLDTGTRLAVERTRLAYERTLMAWVRTAASLISFGFTIYKFFQLELHGGPTESRVIGPRAFATILVVTGIVSLAIAAAEHRRNMQSLRAEYGLALPFSNAGVFAFFIAALGILALLAVVLGL
jgi:putative membrane protein